MPVKTTEGDTLTTAEVSAPTASAAPAQIAARRSASSWFQRWSPLGGLLFVIGALAVAFSPAAGETGETAAETVRFADGKGAWLIVAMVFALAALPLVGSFAVGMAGRLQRLGAGTEAAFVVIGGAAFALLFFVAITIWLAPLADMPDARAAALAQASAYLAIDDIGWVLFGGAGVAAGVMAIAASLGAMRNGAIPAWLGWIGVVLGVASFATVTFFGIFAWLVWIAFASVALLVRR
jgi:hypothetical protein